MSLSRSASSIYSDRKGKKLFPVIKLTNTQKPSIPSLTGPACLPAFQLTAFRYGVDYRRLKKD
jgi:hypothetical protein